MIQFRTARGLMRGAGAFLTALAGRNAAEAAAPIGPAIAPARSAHPAPRPSVELNRCPVCRAAFRGSRICSRCGADLGALMRLTVRAWQMRQSARRALIACDFDAAHDLALEAQGIQATAGGDSIRRVSACLRGVRGSEVAGARGEPR
jgi:hypothetical protein